MLGKIASKVDMWAVEQNQKTNFDNLKPIPKTEIYIVGQTALLEAKLSIAIAATMDVDSYTELNYQLRVKFDELLQEEGRHLDPVGHEAWMPEETKYKSLYKGKLISLSIAEPVYIILSKARMAPVKNKTLILDYIASSDLDHKLFDLAKKYDVDLETL